jgi:hypothetical protein
LTIWERDSVAFFSEKDSIAGSPKKSEGPYAKEILPQDFDPGYYFLDKEKVIITRDPKDCGTIFGVQVLLQTLDVQKQTPIPEEVLESFLCLKGLSAEETQEFLVYFTELFRKFFHV